MNRFCNITFFSQKKLFSLIVIILLLSNLCFGNENEKDKLEVPNGYGGITLGMSVEATKDALKENSDFGYNGDRDVSLLPGENRVLIETDATEIARWSFLEQCWFQFSDDKLYVIILNLNRKKVDYYSVYSSLCKKYGEPVEFSPDRAVWKNDSVQLSLERPLALKYIDLSKFNSLVDESLVEKSSQEKLRDEFLESL